jgi:hypothetical protein
MTLRDRSVPLHPVTRQVLDALRDSDGGLTLSEIETLVGTRFALEKIYTLNRHGFTVGEWDGRYELIAEPKVVA